MWESIDPEIYIDLVVQSRQMSFKHFACGGSSSESCDRDCDCDCDCDCDDGTTETDMDILRSLTSKWQPLIPTGGEVLMVCMGAVTLILDANGAN
jgi:hypothetical protein